ncbi:MAG: DUF72 domain-containing protein [Conexivisphaerales archaeon]
MKVYLGCSGWSYDAWVGPFYPSGSKPADYLKLYSRVFDAVEIDSTFYRLPSSRMIQRWASSTPDNFVFTAKMPKQITHESGFEDYQKLLGYFINSMNILHGKLGCILVQLPPSFTYSKVWKKLGAFLEVLPHGFCYAIEFRHSDWFRSEVYKRLEELNITMAWSETPYTDTPPVMTTSLVYLRLVGDRSIREEQFGRIVKDRSDAIKKWAKNIKEANPDRVFAFSNNHFQGFGPATVNQLRRELGMEELNWSRTMLSYRDVGQRSLFE